MVLPSFDAASSEPLHRQLRHALTLAIEEGHISGLLPSTRALAADLGLSRNTVNSAYMELAAEGFIEAVPRVGYYVNDEFLANPVSNIDSTSMRWPERLRPLPSLGHVTKPVDWYTYPFPFVSGQPDPALFPTRTWNRSLKEALTDDHIRPVLADHLDRDDPILNEMLRKHILPGRGIAATPDEILITAGTQHGIYLVADAILDSTSRVGLEEPGYPDARHIFARRGAGLEPIPVDDQGMIIPDEFATLDAAFVTPSHHYPSNTTMGIGRRQQLLAEAGGADVIVIEDDYDSEFRYVGRPTPALKALDESGRVVYIGSFSKFLAPGLRIGFIVADAALIDHLRDLRRYQMRHTPWLLQRALASLIKRGDYTRSVRRTRIALKAKWECSLDAVEKHFTWDALAQPPTGGTTLWLQGPPGIDMTQAAAGALDAGVVIEPGAIFFLTDPAPTGWFKLGYGAIDLDSIEPGVRTLAGVLASS